MPAQNEEKAFRKVLSSRPIIRSNSRWPSQHLWRSLQSEEKIGGPAYKKHNKSIPDNGHSICLLKCHAFSESCIKNISTRYFHLGNLHLEDIISESMVPYFRRKERRHFLSAGCESLEPFKSDRIGSWGRNFWSGNVGRKVAPPVYISYCFSPNYQQGDERCYEVTFIPLVRAWCSFWVPLVIYAFMLHSSLQPGLNLEKYVLKVRQNPHT